MRMTGSLSIFIVVGFCGCANTPVAATEGKNPAFSNRTPASPPPTLAGTWQGFGTYKSRKMNGKIPYACYNLVARSTETTESCSNYGTPGGTVFTLTIECKDENLSSKGQSLFNEARKLCQSTDQRQSGMQTVTLTSAVPGDGSEDTNASVEPTWPDGSSRDVQSQNAPFTYYHRVGTGSQSHTIEAEFRR